MARILRPHQDAAMLGLRDSLRSGHRRPILQASTGFGKTVIAGAIVSGALDKGKRAIVTVPAIPLIDQTYSSLFTDGIYDVGVIQGDHPSVNPAAPVQVASVQTLERRGVLPKADLVIIDECHKHFKFYEKWMRDPEWANVPFIGLSATPWTKGLGKHYDDLIIVETTQGLIDKGYLAPFRVFAPPADCKPDLKGIGIIADDYNQGQLSKEMQRPKLVADAVTTWLEKGENRPTFVFAVDRGHAQALQAQFEKAGITTGYIDAKTPRNDREMIRRKFHDGQIKVVCNVGCLTTGVDWDVRCIVLCRPTKSEMLYVQMIGRGLRTANGKADCLILDHSDTTVRLGFVTDIHHDKLDDGNLNRSKATKKEREERGPLPKECIACGCIKQANVKKCPHCGFESRIPSKIVHADGELQEVTKTKTKATKEEKQLWYSMFLGICAEKARADGWAAHKYKEKFGVWPRELKKIRLYANEEVRNYVKSRDIAWRNSQRRQQMEAEARV